MKNVTFFTTSSLNVCHRISYLLYVHVGSGAGGSPVLMEPRGGGGLPNHLSRLVGSSEEFSLVYFCSSMLGALDSSQ
jgi:hypothetical protein